MHHTVDKIPFEKEKLEKKKALKILSNKKLGTIIAINKKKITTGIITDGQIRRFNQKKINLLGKNQFSNCLLRLLIYTILCKTYFLKHLPFIMFLYSE